MSTAELEQSSGTWDEPRVDSVTMTHVRQPLAAASRSKTSDGEVTVVAHPTAYRRLLEVVRTGDPAPRPTDDPKDSWFADIEPDEDITHGPLPWVDAPHDTHVSRVRLRVVPNEPPLPAVTSGFGAPSLPVGSVVQAVTAPMLAVVPATPYQHRVAVATTTLLPLQPSAKPVRRAGEGHSPDARRDAATEAAVLDVACEHPGWGAVRVCNAVRRQGIRVSVRDVGRILARHGAWSGPGREALKRSLRGEVLPERARITHEMLVGFEMVAFLLLVVAVSVAWWALL